MSKSDSMGRGVGTLTRILAVLVVAGGLVWSGIGYAQVSYETGTIQGSVQTTTGDPLPNLRIIAEPTFTTGSVQTYTGSDGSYSLIVPVGEYEVRAYFTHYDYVIDTQTVLVEQQQVSDRSRG